MENLIKKYNDIFGKNPKIMGLFWNNPERLKENIEKAIKDNKPYNEYELLSKEEQKAFDNRELLF